MKPKLIILLILLVAVCATLTNGYSQETATQESSEQIILKAWEFLGKGELDKAMELSNKCIELYQDEAKKQQASLTACAPVGVERKYQVLNDVGTAYFIIAEAYKRQKVWDKSIENYQKVIDEFSFAQCWSPRGWFWKIAEDSKTSIENIKARVAQRAVPYVPKEAGAVSTGGCARAKQEYKFVLSDEGTEKIVDYAKYGTFEGMGTNDYKYKITNRKGLSEAVGEGIYPNNSSVYADPDYAKYEKEGALKGSQWEFLFKDDLKLCFIKWATVGEEPGVKQYYTANILERGGQIEHAIKAYYAALVNFPKSVGWTVWKTPWSVGQSARDCIIFLTEQNPNLGIKLVDSYVKVKNGFDNSIQNDTFSIDPGKLIKCAPGEVLEKRTDPSALKIKKTVGEGKVQLVQFENNHWQLRVDGKPYMIKGVTYSPTVIGESPDEGTLTDWTRDDVNKNGIIDGPYEAWVDKNKNEKQDVNEPNVGDFQIMKEMGVNTLRVYHQPFAVDKKILRDLYEKYGIMVIMGDYFGMYAIGSGASWHPGTDYSDPAQRENMKQSVKKMVEEFKDEPYILMWLLGNENNYGVANNSKNIPEVYYSFANEAAGMIKSIDKNHSVAIGNGDTLFLDIFAKNAPEVDVFGCNAYRGLHGFGRSFWENIKDTCDKPVLITEYGCPAFITDKTLEEAQETQAKYLKLAWHDIDRNSAGIGVGNAIGAVMFEWVDEWWKAYEPFTHDIKKSWAGPFPDGWMYEEWLGVTSQGNGDNSPFKRQLRKAYFIYKEMWKE